MIFFHLLVFFVSIVFISLSISGYGGIFYSSIKKNYFLDIFLGLILITFLITLIHFFFKINLEISFLIFNLGLIIFFIRRKFNLLKFFKSQNYYYFIIVFFLLPIFLSQKYHEDFGYYHLPYALGFIEEKNNIWVCKYR